MWDFAGFFNYYFSCIKWRSPLILSNLHTYRDFTLLPTKPWTLFSFALLHDIMMSLTKSLDPSAKGHLVKFKWTNWRCELNCIIQFLHCCLFHTKVYLTKITQGHASEKECPFRCNTRQSNFTPSANSS